MTVTQARDSHAPRVSAQGRGGGARKRGSNAQARLRAVSAAVLLGTHRQQKQAYSAFNVHIKLSLLRASRASALSSPVLDTRHACC